MMSPLGEFLLDAAFSHWLIVAAFAIGLAFGPASWWVLGPLLVVLFATPTLMVVISGMVDHCSEQPNCMIGFGIVLSGVPDFFCLIAGAAGIGVRYLVHRLR